MLNIKQEKQDIIFIEANKKGLNILLLAFQEVFQQIQGEFNTRTGAKREEFEDLLSLIETALNRLILESIKNPVIKINISVAQLRMLTQILNEACHGIKIVDFEKKIGMSKNKLKFFLNLSCDLYDSINNKEN